MFRSILLSAAVLLTAALSGQGATSAYTCTIFNTGAPVGINNRNQLIGSTFAASSSSDSQAFLRDPDGTVTTISYPGTDNSFVTQLTAINNQGQIVGYYYSKSDSGTYHPFLRNADGSFTEITAQPPLPVQNFTQFRITGLNDNGDMAGDLFYTNPVGNIPQQYVFVRDHTGTYTIIGTVTPFHYNSYLAGPLNNSGTVLLPAQTVFDAFLYVPGQPLEPLFGPSGDTSDGTATYGLNNNGVTAGTLFSTPQVGFLRTPDQHFRTMVCPDALSDNTIVTGVNDADAVVGYLSDPSSGTAISGFIATPTGIDPQVELSNISWDFGILTPNKDTASGTIYITNTGTGLLHIVDPRRFAFNNIYPADFSVTDTTCGAELGVQHTCSVTFAFKPSIAGVQTAKLYIIDDAPDSPQVISFHGVGASASLQLSNTFWYLGTYPVGQTSAAGTIYIYANGTNPVSFAGTAIEGVTASDFFITANTCGGTLPAYTTCAISFAYKASAPGWRAASLALHDNASGGPYVIPLYGLGQ